MLKWRRLLRGYYESRDRMYTITLIAPDLWLIDGPRGRGEASTLAEAKVAAETEASTFTHLAWIQLCEGLYQSLDERFDITCRKEWALELRGPDERDNRLLGRYPTLAAAFAAAQTFGADMDAAAADRESRPLKQRPAPGFFRRRRRGTEGGPTE